jgi:hypothetical protein
MMRRELFRGQHQSVSLWLVAAATTLVLGACAARLLDSPNREPILLEVVSRDGGMVCTTEAYLEVRVYASGRVEGEVFSGRCMSRWPRLFSSFSRREAQLNANQLSELEELLKQSDFSMVKESYPHFVVYTDSGTFQTIKFEYEGKEKKVALVNPDPTDARNKANYPMALVNLLLEIQQIRQRLELPAK